MKGDKKKGKASAGATKGKDETKSTTLPDTTEEEEDETEFHVALLEIRVKELETLNMGLKKKCDYLESQNNVYKEQLKEAREEKDDLVTHLQRNYDEEKTNVKELEDRLFGVQQARTDEAKEYERRLTKKDEEFNEMKFNLDKNILELTAKLASVEDFRVQKDKLTAERVELEMNLVEERKLFDQKFQDLENRMIRSRERIKNDASDIVTKMAKDVLKAGRLCLTATVKNAVNENIRLKKEIEMSSMENLKLREDLQGMSDTCRTKKMTIQVLEEENSMVHQKCLQYRKMISELGERQMVMDIRIQTIDHLEKELLDIQQVHGKCKTRALKEKDIFRQMVMKATGALLVKKTKDNFSVGSIATITTALLQQQINSLRDIIVKMAISAKEITEASNPEELEHLKGKFWSMVVKLYEVACDLPNLPQDVKKKLIISVPKVTPFFKCS